MLILDSIVPSDTIFEGFTGEGAGDAVPSKGRHLPGLPISARGSGRGAAVGVRPRSLSVAFSYCLFVLYKRFFTCVHFACACLS